MVAFKSSNAGRNLVSLCNTTYCTSFITLIVDFFVHLNFGKQHSAVVMKP